MKHFLNIIIFSFFVVIQSYTQEEILEKEFKFENASSIYIDHFENYYVLDNYSILKFDKKNNFQYKFTDDLLNENIYFDISDPMKPLVLNKDFYTLKILDNRLGIINEVNLNEVFNGLIDVIISSSSQEYWIFDKLDNKLKKLNYDFVILEESLAFQVLFDSFSEINRIRIENDQLYILDNYGIKTFDLFGNFISDFKINDVKNFQIINQKFVYIKENILKVYDPKIFIEENIFNLGTKESIKEVKITQDNIFLLSNQKLKIIKNNFSTKK